MLRVDDNAQIVRLPLTISSMFVGRRTVRSGKRIFGERGVRPASRFLPISVGRCSSATAGGASMSARTP